MLFKNVLVAATALFGFAAASPIALVSEVSELSEKSVIESRQAAAIKTALLAAEQEAITLRDTFNASTGNDPAEVDKIRAQSKSLLASINSAKAVAEASPNLTLVEALGFSSTINQLQKTVDSTLAVVVQKKQQVDRLGLTKETHDTLVTQKAAIDAFGAVLITKVPVAAKSIAQGYIDNFDKSFDAAIATYASSK